MAKNSKKCNSPKTNFCSNKNFYTPKQTGGTNTPVITCWVLFDGFWHDECFWDDSAIWID